MEALKLASNDGLLNLTSNNGLLNLIDDGLNLADYWILSIYLKFMVFFCFAFNGFLFKCLISCWSFLILRLSFYLMG